MAYLTLPEVLNNTKNFVEFSTFEPSYIIKSAYFGIMRPQHHESLNSRFRTFYFGMQRLYKVFLDIAL